jgi:hypothetical protein
MAKVEIDTQDLVEVQKTIATFKGNKIVIVRATNDSLSGLKTESVKLIGAKVTAKAATIRATFSIKKMALARMSAELESTGPALPLIKYTSTKVKKGVSVRVLKANKKTVVKHAFIATMKSGHKGVFWRRFDDFRVKANPTFNYGFLKGSKYALPLEELYGPAIADIFDDPDIIKPALVAASVRLQARLDHHTNRLIESAR